jgi:hypothetical protein
MKARGSQTAIDEPIDYAGPNVRFPVVPGAVTLAIVAAVATPAWSILSPAFRMSMTIYFVGFFGLPALAVVAAIGGLTRVFARPEKYRGKALAIIAFVLAMLAAAFHAMIFWVFAHFPVQT